ncbi:hypothetical protein FKP32DRAFT_1671769 [Trametes sanguinea]|nr:hypothetical protein FKP32DRAFT_1671769 [Trametes sanguinea]
MNSASASSSSPTFSSSTITSPTSSSRAPTAGIASSCPSSSSIDTLHHPSSSLPTALSSSTPPFCDSLPPSDFQFSFTYYNQGGRAVADFGSFHDAELYMPGTSDLCSTAVNFGFALQDPEPCEDMISPYSADVERLHHDQQFTDMLAHAAMGAPPLPQGSFYPSPLPGIPASSSSSNPSRSPTAEFMPSPHMQYQPTLLAPLPWQGLASHGDTNSIDVAPGLSAPQPQPLNGGEASSSAVVSPANVRRSTRKRAPVARSVPAAPVAKPAKAAKKAKKASAPAQPVASGSNEPPYQPAPGCKQRVRVKRRTRAEVMAQMAPVMRIACPVCGSKFGISREVDVDHVKEHYLGIVYGGQKERCLWDDCEYMVPMNAMVDHINAKHLKMEFRCYLPLKDCDWTSPRPGDIHLHMRRKHGYSAAKRQEEQGDVEDRNFKKRRT